MADLKDELKEIKQLLQEKEKKKVKEFKLPFSSRINSAKARKNFVTLMKLNENGNINFKRVQINEQTFIEEGIPRLAAAGYVMYYKKNPIIILPSWSVEPFSPMVHYNNSLLNGSNAKGFQLLMNKMKLSTIDTKKQISGIFKWIIGLALVGVIVYAFISGGGS